MVVNRRPFLDLLERSPFGCAILMTLIACFLASLLPLEVQAHAPHGVPIAKASAIIRTYDAIVSTPHERNW